MSPYDVRIKIAYQLIEKLAQGISPSSLPSIPAPAQLGGAERKRMQYNAQRADASPGHGFGNLNLTGSTSPPPAPTTKRQGP